MAKQKEAWDKLSMQEKAQLIKLSIDNGVSSLKQIRDTYNLYANGGQEEILNKVNSSNANFAQRLKDPDRKSIPDWESPTDRISTHKLSVGTDENGNHYIFPEVQEINGELIDFTRPPYNRFAGEISAEMRGDTVRVPSLEDAIKFTETYKQYYPFNNGGNLAHKKSGKEQGETQYLKLDDAANYKAYEDATNYFLNLGFGPELASKYAIDRVHNNMTFDAGQLPELDVIAQAWGNGDNIQRMENYQNTQKSKREAIQNIEQAAFNQSIRNVTDKWGKGIGLGMTTLAALPVASGIMIGMNALRASYPIATGLWDAYWAGDGIVRNLFGDNGIKKTYRLAKQGDIKGAVKSGIVDILDLTGAYFPIDVFQGNIYNSKVLKRALEGAMRQSSGPVPDITQYVNLLLHDKDARKYILTGKIKDRTPVDIFGPYQGFFGGVPQNNIPWDRDYISAVVHGTELDPRIATKIATGENFGPALTEYIHKNYKTKAPNISVYQLDNPLQFTKKVENSELSHITNINKRSSAYLTGQSMDGDFLPNDLTLGTINVGGYSSNTGLLNGKEVIQGTDIWKFNPKDYTKKWLNFEPAWSKLAIHMADKLTTPIVTKTAWGYVPTFSTGGPLYPFSFEKNPFLKTPVVRYDEGGFFVRLFGKKDTPPTPEEIKADRVERFINDTWETEYSVPKGYDPVTGLYFPYDSPEGGTKTIGPGFKLREDGSGDATMFTAKEAARGVTREQINEKLRAQGELQYDKVLEFLNQKGNRLPVDTINPNIMNGLMDLRFQVGALGGWDNLREAVLNGDLESIKKESLVTFKDGDTGKIKPDVRRNELRAKKFWHYD